MTAKEFLVAEAKRFGFRVNEAWGEDMEIRPDTGSVEDLMQLVANLDKHGYQMSFMRDNCIRVKAPHYKKHDWETRGWDCNHALTVQGCEVFHMPNATDSQKLRAGLSGRQMARG